MQTSILSKKIHYSVLIDRTSVRLLDAMCNLKIAILQNLLEENTNHLLIYGYRNRKLVFKNGYLSV